MGRLGQPWSCGLPGPGSHGKRCWCGCWELCLCRQRAEAEELRRQLEASSSALTRALRDEYAKEKEDQERRHQVWFPLTSSPLGAAPPSLGPHRGSPSQHRKVPGLSCCFSFSSQTELKVLKDQLELEKQAWEANYVKKEVMARAVLQRSHPWALRRI